MERKPSRSHSRKTLLDSDQVPKSGKSRGKSESTKESENRQKMYKPGRITRNPFLNFLREYRLKNCGESVLQIARSGAAIWRTMDRNAKDPYYKQAQAIPKSHSKRHKKNRSVQRKRHKSRRRD